MEIYEFITITIALIGVLIALFLGVRQATFAKGSMERDYKSRRIQAALEYMDSIRESYHSLNNDLRNTDPIYRSTSIGEDGASRLFDKANAELRDKVRELLSIFERLAVGVNKDAYDFDTIKRISRSYLITVFDRYSAYINQARKVDTNNSLFEEYEILVRRLKSTD